MKKLQLFALLMLLSTGYIAQASGTSNNMPNGGSSKRMKKGGQMQHQMMTQAEILSALGATTLSYDAISAYAGSYADAIDTLSASSTSADIQAVMKQGMVINQAIMMLAPKPAKSNNLPTGGSNKAPRHGGMRRNMPAGSSSGNGAPGGSAVQ
jgi:hypothetical protein